MGHINHRNVYYAYDELLIAVCQLAMYPGRIHERLSAACTAGLAFIADVDFPTQELRAEWNSICARIGDPKTGRDATSRLSEQDASIVAEDILALERSMREWLNVPVDVPNVHGEAVSVRSSAGAIEDVHGRRSVRASTRG